MNFTGILSNSIKRSFLILFFLVFTSNSSWGQVDSLKKERKARTGFILAATGGVWLGTMAVLSSYWYSNDAKTEFHFFNDNSQWLQVDKMGHFYSAFQISRLSAGMYRWAHQDQRKAAFYGALTGLVLMTPIEILDGYSASYGASSGDLMANFFGAAFFLGQELLWKEERIKVKFSYHPTQYAGQRPDVLGSGSLERLIKDYNGQTYWLSVDLYSFLGKRNKWLKWVNPGFGMGAEAMVYARQDQNLENTGLRSYRQFYFSLDPSLTHLKSKSKLLNTLIFIVDAIKIPSPTLEWSDGKVHFYPLFF
jgi:Predicted periplasmic lipoprotein (DUF2279)